MRKDQVKITKFPVEMSQMTMCIWLKLRKELWTEREETYLVHYRSKRSDRSFSLQVFGWGEMRMKLDLGERAFPPNYESW